MDSDLREYLGVIMNGPRPPIPNLDKILKASEDKELWDYFFTTFPFESPIELGPKVWYDDVREKSTAEILGRLYTGIWEENKPPRNSKKLEGPKVTRDWDRFTIEGETKRYAQKHHCCCCCKCSK